jgi:predicted transcriptional regulator YheO
MDSIEKANMKGEISRRQFAKMISEFAIKVMNKKPNTSTSCTFSDTKNESDEMKFYIKTACQL